LTADERRALVLVVEDEPPIADVLRLYLDRAGFDVAVAGDGPQGLAMVHQRRPDAVILDVGLPGMDGTEICRRMRADGDWTPVLFCTARDDEIDRVLGLEMGADDYITKPFSPREVVARVRVALRHARGADPGDVITLGRVSLDRSARRVTVDGGEIALTATEFDLLAYLMERPGRVITRDVLLEEVWGYAAVVGTRTVDVHVAQVRSKLGDASPLRTVRGVGYSAEEP
jgi:DNA-binding response OmpR family regulator